MKPLRLIYSALLVAGVGIMIFFGCQKQNTQPKVTSDATGGKGAGAYSPVNLTCAGSNTQSTIALIVTAGSTGAPAGFSIQWMTQAQFDAIGDVWPADTITYCKASFSGVPYGSKNTQQTGGNTYNLPANGSVVVYIGDLLNDELNQQLGLSTTCSDGLTCGTKYVFRAFAHGNSTMNRSIYSFLNDACATTVDCSTVCSHHGIGFWKNNPDQVAAVLNGGTLNLGTTAYTADQLVAILNTPPTGNGYTILAHQLIAAELNGLCSNLTGPANADIGSVTFTGTTAPVTVSAKTSFSAFAGIIGTLHNHNENCLDCPAAPIPGN